MDHYVKFALFAGGLYLSTLGLSFALLAMQLMILQPVLIVAQTGLRIWGGYQIGRGRW